MYDSNHAVHQMRGKGDISHSGNVQDPTATSQSYMQRGTGVLPKQKYLGEELLINRYPVTPDRLGRLHKEQSPTSEAAACRPMETDSEGAKQASGTLICSRQWTATLQIHTGTLTRMRSKQVIQWWYSFWDFLVCPILNTHKGHLGDTQEPQAR